MMDLQMVPHPSPEKITSFNNNIVCISRENQVKQNPKKWVLKKQRASIYFFGVKPDRLIHLLLKKV